MMVEYGWKVAEYAAYFATLFFLTKWIMAGLEKRMDVLEADQEKNPKTTLVSCESFRENCPVALALDQYRELTQVRENVFEEKIDVLFRAQMDVKNTLNDGFMEMRKEFKDHRDLHLEIAKKLGQLNGNR